MLWMCCLSFAQEENELGLLLGAEFIPRAATTSSQKLSFGKSVAYSVDYARRLSRGNTALLLEFPFPAGLGYGLYEGSSVLQNGVANTEIHRNVATAQFGGGIDVRTQLKLLFPIGFRGEFRDFYTLGNPSFGIPVQRSEQINLVVSGGLVVHFWPAAARTSPSEYGRSDARSLRRAPELVL
jgi:hypothetical protein